VKGVGGSPTEVGSIQFFESLVQAAADGLILARSDGTIAFANLSAGRLFGYDPSELVDQPVEILVPPALGDRHRAHRAGFEADPVSRPMGMGLELLGQHKDGSTLPVEVSLSPVKMAGTVMTMACIRNMSDLRRLRDLNLSTLEAAERERERIARDLHDDTLQRLSALLLGLRVLQRDVDVSTGAALSAISDDLMAAAEGLRAIARGLRPPELSDLGLTAAVRAAARRAEQLSGGTVVDVDMDSVADRLSPEQALVVYRVVQESLNNALRHASATGVHVLARIRERGVRVEITDDGAGFDVEAALAEGRGLGLQGLLERGASVGGQVTVRSELGRGTSVRLDMPLTVQAEPVA